ncbi:hypothetical protein B0H16DRAFT_1448634 [Mycena metata]|uniref:Uncharacterized protein n=1 Tax=Mycena metata TaxID=1033252 RepID=A0AAD7K6D3_9AGAR|nr:hypothetical protein B0H16DRAFT_1448634 [Mycena metata]
MPIRHSSASGRARSAPSEVNLNDMHDRWRLDLRFRLKTGAVRGVSAKIPKKEGFLLGPGFLNRIIPVPSSEDPEKAQAAGAAQSNGIPRCWICLPMLEMLFSLPPRCSWRCSKIGPAAGAVDRNQYECLPSRLLWSKPLSGQQGLKKIRPQPLLNSNLYLWMCLSKLGQAQLTYLPDVVASHEVPIFSSPQARSHLKGFKNLAAGAVEFERDMSCSNDPNLFSPLRAQCYMLLSDLEHSVDGCLPQPELHFSPPQVL